MDCSPPGSSVMGFSRQDYWSGLPCPPPGDLPNPGIKPVSPMSPTLADGFFTTSATWEGFQFSPSVVSDSLQPHGLQHARLPCPSPTLGACSNSIESVMPSNHLILCHPLLLLPSIFPSIRVFSSESALHIRQPK